MLFCFEIREVSLVFRVLFEYGSGFSVFDTIFLEIRYLVIEEESINSFVLIVGTYGDKQEVECLHLFCFECFEEFNPAKWE